VEEYEKSMIGLTAILREAWTTLQQTEYRREKTQALSLAKECYSMKLEMLTNATVVDDAVRFVSSQQLEEKAKVHASVIKGQDNSSDVQGSEKENQQQQYTIDRATTNQTF
jgi:hypothetical protein